MLFLFILLMERAEMNDAILSRCFNIAGKMIHDGDKFLPSALTKYHF